MLSLFKKNIIKCSSNSACLLVVWLWYRARFFSMPWWRHDSYLESPEQGKCQQQSTISSRTPFICNSNFTSSFNTSWFFLALSSLLGNSVFQFSLKFFPIVNIFQLKKIMADGFITGNNYRILSCPCITWVTGARWPIIHRLWKKWCNWSVLLMWICFLWNDLWTVDLARSLYFI